MALSPEKNDVDISSLFYYRKPVQILDKNAEPVTFYMRLVGDAELQRARVMALRDSRKLRDALKDPNSDEHLAYIPSVEDIEKDKLIEVITLSKIKEVSIKVMDEIEIPFPTEPSSDATLEEQEEYQKQVDEYPAKREKLLQAEIIKRTGEEKKKLQKQNLEDLKKEYLLSLRNELCEMTLTASFYNHIVFFSLYKDKNYKTRLFTDYEEYENLPAEIKEELLEEYKSLELGTDELKK